jgi:N-acetylmuramoyl-L-alanine amidase
MFRALALLLFALSAQAVEVRDARLSNSSGSSRVILDLSGKAEHRFLRLANPERLVLDIRGARVSSRQRVAVVPSGAVKGVRLGQRGKSDLRVVVDLSRKVKARSYLASPTRREGYRLIIEWEDGEASPAMPASSTDVALTTGGGVTAAAPSPAIRDTGRDVPVRDATARELPVKAEHAPADARDLVIAIDAGHGGEDPGATGKNGTHEKDVVLAIAKELAQQVNAEPGMRAVLIRDGDVFVPLRDRMQRARMKQADLFVSVHADSIRNRAVTGSSVYILSPRGATDEAARWLAERENAADLVGGVSLENKDDVLASVLLDLSQTAALNASQAAASSVLHRLDQIGEVRKRQVQQARFIVLKSPDVPSMLVETAYISNPGEERRLRSRGYQGRLAVAIHQGIKDFFYANPPSGTRVAQLAAQKSSLPSAGLVGKLNGAGT